MHTTLPDASRSAGELIGGRYRLGELLGVGGMAEVYAATDLRLDREVAVKLLRPHMAAREDVRTRFQAEARAAAGLSHPNAVSVFDTGGHDGTPFLVMERLPGETLADRIAAAAGSGLDPAWLRQTAVDVLGALGAAHDAGIVHRDVKPGNILIAADGSAKIADFGIAKSLGSTGAADLTATGQLLGTPAYLAPERLDGTQATPQADIYAIGVVLYEALTGTKPFEGNSPLAVAQAVVAGDHVPLGERRPDLDANLVASVERAMAREPDARFGRAQDMAGALSGEPSDPTVDEAPAGSTMFLATADIAAASAAARTKANAKAPRPPLSRRAWAVMGAIGVVLLLILVSVAGGSPDERAQANAPTTTGAPAAVPAATDSVPAALRALADRLGPSDGRRAGELATALRRVADRVDAGGGFSDATSLLVTVAQWNAAGDLGSGATVSAIDLLRQVVSGVAQPSVGSPQTPPSGDTGSSGNGKAKGKDKDSDEDDD